MNDYPDTLTYIFRFSFVGLLIFGSIFLLSFLFSSAGARNAHALGVGNSVSSLTDDMSESPNFVASGVANAVDTLGKITAPKEPTTASNVQATAASASRNGQSVLGGVGSGTASAFRGIGSGFVSATHAVGTGVTGTASAVGGGFATVYHGVGAGAGFVVSVPGKILQASTTAVRSAVRPSEFAEVSVIDPESPELYTAIANLPPVQTAQTAPPANAGPLWPIHGAITTQFGASDWPYQRVHTGIDISDGRPSGTTPVKAFRSGKVITASGGTGLGNHVIVDHGNGVTSVYGHLASIAVQVGQDVTADTTLGLEGTTGRSTGTHLHFEVRVNGQAADPHKFIAGQPYS